MNDKTVLALVQKLNIAVPTSSDIPTQEHQFSVFDATTKSSPQNDVKKTQQKITSKAMEYFRLLDIKCPQGLGSTASICKTFVCIEFACKTMARDFPQEAAIKLCGTTLQSYQQSFLYMQNALKLKFPVSIHELCIKYKCLSKEALVQENIEQFKQAAMQKVQQQQQKSKPIVDLQSNPSYYLAAFYMTVTRGMDGIKLDKQKLTQDANCQMQQFTTVLQDMMELMYPEELAKMQQEKKLRAKKNSTPSTSSKSTPKKRKLDEIKENEAPTPDGTMNNVLTSPEKLDIVEQDPKRRRVQQKLTDFM